MRTTYRSALTKCAQITHIVPPVTVQPLAMWLSMHLIQNFFSLGTYFSSLCDPKLHLGRPPRLSLRLLPLTAPLRRCFVLYTFSKVRTTYRSALTKCAQITHIVPPVTVQLLAMWLSMHLIQNFFPLGTYFSSLCNPKWQLGRPPRLSRRLHPHFSLNNCRGFAATYRTVCYGWRVGIV